MKFKLFFLSSSVLGPIALFTTACSAVYRFDQVDDGKIKLATVTSASASGSLTTIISKYNSQKDPNDYPVELVSLDSRGSYSNGKKDLQAKLLAKDKNNFYNLTFNYSDVVSILSRSQMELSFDTVDTSNFDPSFLSFNNNISNVNPNSIYALPATVSGEVLVLNGPVLHYILSSAKKDSNTTLSTHSASNNSNKGTMVVASDSETSSLWTKLEAAAKMNAQTNETQVLKSNSSESNQTQASDTEIKKIWGDYQEVDGGLKNYTFKASVFNNWKDLNDFATRIAKSFTKLQTTTKKGEEVQAVFGIDSLENALYTALFASGKADYNNFLFNIKNQRINFSNFFNKSSTAFQNLKTIFNSFKSLIDQNGLISNAHFNTPVNDYAKFNQLAFYTSSTARFPYSFASDSVKRLIVNDKTIENKNNKSVFEVNLSSDSDNNSNLIGTVSLENSKQVSLYEKQVDSNKQIGVDALLIKDETLINHLKSLKSQVSAKSASETSQTKQNKTFLAFTTVNADQKAIFDVGKLNGKTAKIIINATETTNAKISTLQEKEAIVLKAPQRFESTDPFPIALVQGPSLIGIHANEREDIETKKFVNWYLNTKVQWEENSIKTPAEYVADKASYLLPFKNRLNNTNSYNEFVKTAVSQFADKNVTKFAEPADFLSNKVRDGVKSNLNAAINNHSIDFDSFINDLTDYLGSDVKNI